MECGNDHIANFRDPGVNNVDGGGGDEEGTINGGIVIFGTFGIVDDEGGGSNDGDDKGGDNKGGDNAVILYHS
jgi:hypothetical protein